MVDLLCEHLASGLTVVLRVQYIPLGALPCRAVSIALSIAVALSIAPMI